MLLKVDKKNRPGEQAVFTICTISVDKVVGISLEVNPHKALIGVHKK